MKTIDVTLTVRDEQGNITLQEEWSHHESFMTYQCDHDIWDPLRIKEDFDERGKPPTCGWCTSQGRDGTLKPVEAVLCEMCEEYFEVDYFIKHHIGECGT